MLVSPHRGISINAVGNAQNSIVFIQTKRMRQPKPGSKYVTVKLRAYTIGQDI